MISFIEEYSVRLNHLEIWNYISQMIVLVASIYSVVFILALLKLGYNKIRVKAHKYVLKNFIIEDGSTPKLTILIHGTFTNVKTNWVDSNSDMSKELEAYSNGENKVCSFSWTGINSFSARLTASIALQKIIGKIKKDYPHCEITLIGHSHGGSIALHAANSLLSEYPDVKVVCLGSPVLTSADHDDVQDRHKYAELVFDLVISSLMLMIPIGYLTYSFCNEVMIANPSNIFCSISTGINQEYQFNFIIYSLLLLSLILLRKRIGKKFTNTIGEIKLKKINILQMRTIGDEAAAVINTLYGINRISQALTILPIKLIERASKSVSKNNARLVSIVISAFFIVSLSIVIVTFFLNKIFVDFQSAQLVLVITLIIVFLISTLLIILSMKTVRLLLRAIISTILRLVLFPFIVLLHSITGFGCGPETALVGSWINFSAENVPVGTWQLKVFAPSTTDKLALNHSDLYSRPDIIEDINKFIWNKL